MWIIAWHALVWYSKTTSPPKKNWKKVERCFLPIVFKSGHGKNSMGAVCGKVSLNCNRPLTKPHPPFRIPRPFEFLCLLLYCSLRHQFPYRSSNVHLLKTGYVHVFRQCALSVLQRYQNSRQKNPKTMKSFRPHQLHPLSRYSLQFPAAKLRLATPTMHLHAKLLSSSSFSFHLCSLAWGTSQVHGCWLSFTPWMSKKSPNATESAHFFSYDCSLWRFPFVSPEIEELVKRLRQKWVKGITSTST